MLRNALLVIEAVAAMFDIGAAVLGVFELDALNGLTVRPIPAAPMMCSQARAFARGASEDFLGCETVVISRRILLLEAQAKSGLGTPP